jgi:hypothetical protein
LVGPAKPALVRQAGVVGTVTNINQVLDGHVRLEVECVDRMLLNAYVPNLQVSGQVVMFCTRHLGFPVPSPAIFQQIGTRFRRRVKTFAATNDVPLLVLRKGPDRSRWDDRKIDHVQPYVEAAEQEGRFGVVAIISAMETQWVFGGRNRAKDPKVCSWDFNKESRRVGVYYFYVLDPDFGVGFIKICTYFPYPAKVWVNGHEWAKRQATRAGIAWEPLANGFASCGDPEGLREICDSFGPDDVQGFFDRWIHQIPTPLTGDDRQGGYWWELSMRQVEVSRTLVLDDPRRARRFFEALVADNIGIGRPEEVAVVFGRRVQRNTPGQFRTRVFEPGVEVKMDFAYKHSRVKQYLKEGRAFRIETVINKPRDIGCNARLEHLPELIARCRQVNRRLLEQERAAQGCAIGDDVFDRLHQPLTEGQRTGAFRFGDTRAMALCGALCVVANTVTGFTNKSLRGLVAGLLGTDYSANQMTYDLRRLRLHGLIERIPGTIRYQLTPEGTRTVVFYTKLRDRLLGPLLNAGHQPPTPIELRRALKQIDRSLTGYLTDARLDTAA